MELSHVNNRPHEDTRVGPTSLCQELIDILAVGPKCLRPDDIDNILYSDKFNNLKSKEALRPIFLEQKEYYYRRVDETIKELNKGRELPIRIIKKGDPIIDPNIKKVLDDHYGRRGWK